MDRSVRPDGTESVTRVPVAVEGPRFDTVTVKVTLLETSVELGEAMWVIAKSAAGLMAVVTAAELLANTGSTVDELLMVAVLVMLPSARGLTVIVTVALALLPSAPKAAGRTPL